MRLPGWVWVVGLAAVALWFLARAAGAAVGAGGAGLVNGLVGEGAPPTSTGSAGYRRNLGKPP